MDISSLDAIFSIYGYELHSKNSDLRVYTLNQGMYNAAEIIPITSDAHVEKAFDEYSKLGFACKVSQFSDITSCEEYLFKGFFQTNLANKKIDKRYSDFAKKQVQHYGDEDIKYQYIDVPYISNDINNGYNDSIIVDVNDILNRDGAFLIIIEAAAGFGKTCTAFEIYRSFLNSNNLKKPLFTELSRNRDARRFKYVLWSEIEAEYNSLIKSDLVIYNIQEGKIPLIIDGFDELLSKNIDRGAIHKRNEFEQVESMLSTIGELLKKNAKVILTSRKTAIFSGEEFNRWVESYSNTFSVIRFQIEKPEVKHWLPDVRYNNLLLNSVPLDHISNPVLLTYLRNIDDTTFEDLVKDVDKIVEKYFEYLLVREQERQDIIIPYDEQLNIFERLAGAFAEFDISCETRSFVKELIIDNNKEILEFYRKLSPNHPTIDELSDRLTNHALLDRTSYKDFIGFINEFIFGILLGEYILKNKDILVSEDFLSEEVLEKVIHSFRYQSSNKKEKLRDVLKVCDEIYSQSLRMLMDVYLLQKVIGKFISQTFTSQQFSNVNFNDQECSFENCVFTDCKFENCNFACSVFNNVSFIGCKFIECNVIFGVPIIEVYLVYFYGCDDYDTGFISLLSSLKSNGNVIELDKDYEKLILSKFFRVDGRTPRMKLISTIKDEVPQTDRELIFDIFHSLKKRGLIKTNGNNAFISQEGLNYYNNEYR